MSVATQSPKRRSLMNWGGYRPGAGRDARAESVSRVVPFRLSPTELRRAAEAAQVNHQSLSDFIRQAVTTAAADCLEPLPDDLKS